MIKYILLYIFSSCMFASLGCEIKLFDRYVKQTNKVSNQLIPFESTTCNDETNHLVSSKILELSGSIPTSYILDSLALPVMILPEKISIFNLDELILKKSLDSTAESQKILKYQSSHPGVAIGLDQLDIIEISCKDCTNTNAKIFQIITKSTTTDQIRKFYVNAKIGHKFVVLKNKLALKPDNAPVLSSNFETHETYLESPEDYISNDTDLSYYKLNTVLKPGTYLQKRYLSKMFLTQTGRDVEITLDHNGFLLQTRGTAMQNGAINDFIKVKNFDSKRIIQAKVIGENRVRIDI